MKSIVLTFIALGVSFFAQASDSDQNQSFLPTRTNCRKRREQEWLRQKREGQKELKMVVTDRDGNETEMSPETFFGRAEDNLEGMELFEHRCEKTLEKVGAFLTHPAIVTLAALSALATFGIS